MRSIPGGKISRRGVQEIPTMSESFGDSGRSKAYFKLGVLEWEKSNKEREENQIESRIRNIRERLELIKSRGDHILRKLGAIAGEDDKTALPKKENSPRRKGFRIKY